MSGSIVGKEIEERVRVLFRFSVARYRHCSDALNYNTKLDLRLAVDGDSWFLDRIEIWREHGKILVYPCNCWVPGSLPRREFYGYYQFGVDRRTTVQLGTGA